MTNIKEFIYSCKNLAIDLEKKLTAEVALPPENGGDGETKKAEVLINWLKQNGYTNIEQYNAPDKRVSSGFRPNIVVTIPGQSDQYCIWSIAHLDVVPSGDLKLWNTNPWECVEKDGILYGRGVEDNQQGLVSTVLAGLYFIKNNIKPSHTLKFLFAADEECGSQYGIIWLLKNTKLFKKQDFVIIPDSGDSKGESIEIAEKNLIWLKIHVVGKQTHGSRPDSGANACLAACDLTMKINNLSSIFNKTDDLFKPNYSTFQPTMRLQNVDGVNIISGEDTFCFDCRILPCYPLKDVTNEIDKLISIVEKEHKVKIKYETLQYSQSPATKQDAPVVKKLADALKKVHGINAKCVGIGGGTVAAELRREGLDAAVWSTLNDMAHKPNEYCIIENLLADSMTMVEVFK